jgi:hypothetical protein
LDALVFSIPYGAFGWHIQAHLNPYPLQYPLQSLWLQCKSDSVNPWLECLSRRAEFEVAA